MGGLLGASAGAADAPPAPRVVRYDVRIGVDMEARAIAGETVVTVERPAGAAPEIRFPRNQLSITSISVDGRELDLPPPEAEVVVPLPDAPGRTRIRFEHDSRPARGVVFGEGFVYSDFFTCRWMPCREEPGEKAVLSLDVEVPEGFRVVASGRRVDSRPGSEGRRRERWVEDRPHPSYLFGFAAGEMAESRQEDDGVELLFLGVGETQESLARKLDPTAAMLRFFTEKAGTALPGERYTQVVVPDSAAQEKSSFSIIGKSELDPILEDATEDWVIAHELAHQWWGNSLTCRDWSHFWLNEGIATYMVAAYKQTRWGQHAYDREIGLFEARRRGAIEAGWDVPLAYAGEYPSLAIRRAIVYAKGALFLHALREHLGDGPFWDGLRTYTQAHIGGSVESRDLQEAFESATGADLGELFTSWVGPEPSPRD